MYQKTSTNFFFKLGNDLSETFSFGSQAKKIKEVKNPDSPATNRPRTPKWVESWGAADPTNTLWWLSFVSGVCLLFHGVFICLNSLLVDLSVRPFCCYYLFIFFVTKIACCCPPLTLPHFLIGPNNRFAVSDLTKPTDSKNECICQIHFVSVHLSFFCCLVVVGWLAICCCFGLSVSISARFISFRLCEIQSKTNRNTHTPPFACTWIDWHYNNTVKGISWVIFLTGASSCIFFKGCHNRGFFENILLQCLTFSFQTNIFLKDH